MWSDHSAASQGRRLVTMNFAGAERHNRSRRQAEGTDRRAAGGFLNIFDWLELPYSDMHSPSDLTCTPTYTHPHTHTHEHVKNGQKRTWLKKCWLQNRYEYLRLPQCLPLPFPRRSPKSVGTPFVSFLARCSPEALVSFFCMPVSGVKVKS